MADFQRDVLESHWPGIPRWRDIRELNGGEFYERTGLRTVDVISGGFPCQPVSLAGKRRGREDDRFLWPEMFRVISELRPAWVVGENVAGLLRVEIDSVLSDLEGADYSCRAFVLPACAVGAPHRRERVAIVAHTNRKRLQETYVRSGVAEPGRHPAVRIERGGVPWKTERPVPGVDDGVPHQVDCVRSLGNAVVPQQFYPIFRAIAEIERSNGDDL